MMIGFQSQLTKHKPSSYRQAISWKTTPPRKKGLSPFLIYWAETLQSNSRKGERHKTKLQQPHFSAIFGSLGRFFSLKHPLHVQCSVRSARPDFLGPLQNRRSQFPPARLCYLHVNIDKFPMTTASTSSVDWTALPAPARLARMTWKNSEKLPVDPFGVHRFAINKEVWNKWTKHISPKWCILD